MLLGNRGSHWHAKNEVKDADIFLFVKIKPQEIVSTPGCDFFTYRLQVIIPGSWIFSLIITFPGFLVTNFDKKLGSCGETFPGQWMAKAYSLTWILATTAVPLALMVGLYSMIVYTLWFKRNDDNELTYRQKVCVNYNLSFKDYRIMSYVTGYVTG